MQVNLIAAVANGGIIGNKGKLPWYIPEDLKRFRELTIGKPCIMGRKTWESLPDNCRPLSGRQNIVLSRAHRNNFSATLHNEVIHGDDLESVIAYCRNYEKGDPFIIGGAKVYEEALEKGLVDKLYLTHILASFEGDAYFPIHLTTRDKYKLIESNKFKHKSEDYFYYFEEYERIR